MLTCWIVGLLRSLVRRERKWYFASQTSLSCLFMVSSCLLIEVTCKMLLLLVCNGHLEGLDWKLRQFGGTKAVGGRLTDNTDCQPTGWMNYHGGQLICTSPVLPCILLFGNLLRMIQIMVFSKPHQVIFSLGATQVTCFISASYSLAVNVWNVPWIIHDF